MNRRFICFIAVSFVLAGCASKSPEAQTREPADMTGDNGFINLPYTPTIVIEDDTDDAEPDAEEEKSYPPGYFEEVTLNPSWEYADFSAICDGTAKLYRASSDRKDIVIGLNAGHGTRGGELQKTYCHPDKTPKVTGGSTASGSIKATAVSGGMTFADGTPEAAVTLRTAQILRDMLLEDGFDVLMLRDDEDVQLDNVARTLICNNTADCMISLHWDGDGLSYDKGCFFVSVPEKLKTMEPVSNMWQEHDSLGQELIDALNDDGHKISGKGSMAVDLTQMSYSTIPSVDIELGNAASAHDDDTLTKLAQSLADGIASAMN